MTQTEKASSNTDFMIQKASIEDKLNYIIEYPNGQSTETTRIPMKQDELVMQLKARIAAKVNIKLPEMMLK